MDVPHRRRSLLLALLLSFALHLTLFNLPVPEGEAVARSPEQIEVALLPPDIRVPAEPAHEEPRQIVSPPDVVNDQPPERARFESDRDNTVIRETVKPGVPRPAAPAPRAKPALPVHRPPAREEAKGENDGDEEAASRSEPAKRQVPSLDDLFASTDELVRAQQEARERREADEKREGQGTGRRRVAIAVPPVTPEWALSGDRGTMDNLPDIQRGDVTLLNTKANVFSPFVRRVGERVFQHLVIRQRRLELEQILSAQSPVQMRVLLDPHGRLKSVRVEEQSGSATMDETLSDALRTAAFDNNPPVAAANPDGNYEFVFQAQLRAFQPGPGGVPSRIESRLSVGLL